MATSNQITPGMTISVGKKIYRVESSTRVNPSRGAAFVKTKLRDILTDKLIEKNFKLDQEIKEVSVEERSLEYLYPEGKNHLFLDINSLENVEVATSILADKINFLKEGVVVTAMFYGDAVFSIELPLFLELMVVKTEASSEKVTVSNSTKKAVLETGAEIDVPLFVETGDIVKVDTHQKEYIQRV